MIYLIAVLIIASEQSSIRYFSSNLMSIVDVRSWACMWLLFIERNGILELTSHWISQPIRRFSQSISICIWSACDQCFHQASLRPIGRESDATDIINGRIKVSTTWPRPLSWSFWLDFVDTPLLWWWDPFNPEIQAKFELQRVDRIYSVELCLIEWNDVVVIIKSC